MNFNKPRDKLSLIGESLTNEICTSEHMLSTPIDINRCIEVTYYLNLIKTHGSSEEKIYMGKVEKIVSVIGKDKDMYHEDSPSLKEFEKLVYDARDNPNF